MIWEWESILNALLGGGLIGLAASLMLFFNGRVTGISGIYSGVFSGITPDFFWRLALILGLILGGAVVHQLSPELFVNNTNRSLLHLALAGIIVGFGALLGSGCTSGHGICGLSRLSLRSHCSHLELYGFGICHGHTVGEAHLNNSQVVSSFLVGFVFAIGLAIAGMTQPEKIIGFLDVLSGQWDPSLAFVMLGAIPVHYVSHWLLKGRTSPLFDTQFHMPQKKELNKSLLIGGALFGVGWGLGGYCPGPALASVASGAFEVLVFVGSMTIGMFLFRFYQKTLGA